MKRLHYKKLKDGSWEQPIMRGYKLVCCDCGLVHRMDFRIAGRRKVKRVQFRAYRAVLETKRFRKQQGITVR